MFAAHCCFLFGVQIGLAPLVREGRFAVGVIGTAPKFAALACPLPQMAVRAVRAWRQVNLDVQAIPLDAADFVGHGLLNFAQKRLHSQLSGFNFLLLFVP